MSIRGAERGAGRRRRREAEGPEPVGGGELAGAGPVHLHAEERRPAWRPADHLRRDEGHRGAAARPVHPHQVPHLRGGG